MTDRLRDLQPRRAELAVGLESLGSLLTTGMSMARVLDTFEAVAPAGWRPHLVDIRARVRNGTSLSAAIDQSTLRFPAATLGVMRAGEERGSLAESVRQAAAQAAAEAAARQALINALTYPMLLAVAGTGTLVLMSTVVLPRFATLLSDADVPLPRSTAIILAMGTAVGRWSLPAVALAAIGALIAQRWLQNAQHRAMWHATLLDLPVIGRLRLHLASARLGSTLANLIGAGVPLPRALDVAAGATGDAAMEQRVRTARAAIIAGEGGAAALARTRALSDSASRLATAGEASGRLAEMLRHGADLDQQAAAQGVRLAARIMEPALVIVIGGLIATMAAGLLQTMYALRP